MDVDRNLLNTTSNVSLPCFFWKHVNILKETFFPYYSQAATHKENFFGYAPMVSSNNVNIQLIFTAWNAQLHGDSLLRKEVSEALNWYWNRRRRAILFHTFLRVLKRVLDNLQLLSQWAAWWRRDWQGQENLSVLCATVPSNLVTCVLERASRQISAWCVHSSFWKYSVIHKTKRRVWARPFDFSQVVQ